MTKLITCAELSKYSLNELHGLHRQLFNALVQSQCETYQRRNSLTSLENISNEINSRYTMRSP